MAEQLGLKFFEEVFKEYQDQYVLIGGSATQLAMEDAGQQFSRTTKDLDIVVIVDALTMEFIERFWQFIKEGKYQIQQKSDGTKQFYRFKKPQTFAYPVILELFSRKPDFLRERNHREIIVIPLVEQASSLSAILLEDDYYELIKNNKKDNFIWVDAKVLIPLKARAWLDLSRRKRIGERIDSSDVRKHLRDILRLVSILPTDFRYSLPPTILSDMQQFLELAKEENIDLSGLNHPKGTTLASVFIQLGQAFL
ncbi:hypothetical protein [Polynucleobacter kasalickyi]|uniref:Nucleotidyl transferase AbiEii/AbiGii toxin family protein n=1 Tax=Polynucleobacter kasalickyi TaxID=1938817 RepID=A0A1W2AL21_9BURK|nr:hypothetical protein [Polynucleobacter kasalickyi]SMC61151.1 hypothetical protein SAMN06296008_10931 [Polynucleobacter kasalickyi]